MKAPFSAPTGRLNHSPGQRPGNSVQEKLQALKGRSNLCRSLSPAFMSIWFSAPRTGNAFCTTRSGIRSTLENHSKKNKGPFWNGTVSPTMKGMFGIRPPFQGLVFFMGRCPRALPWAGLNHPFGVAESRTLVAVRDALLPKLLSGELRVPAAAKLVEDQV